MSNFLVSLFLALGTGAWAYSFTYHRTGGNTRNSLVVAGVCGAIVFLVLFLILTYSLSNDGNFV